MICETCSKKSNGPYLCFVDQLDDWVLCRIYKKKLSLDPDREDSILESEIDVKETEQPSIQENSFLKLPKSCSLTELLGAADYSALARMLENPPDILGPESYPSSNQSLDQYGNDSFIPEFNPPALFTHQHIKRKQQEVNNSCFREDNLTEFSIPAKKQPTHGRMFTSFNDNELGHVLLLKSQLGLESSPSHKMFKPEGEVCTELCTSMVFERR